MTDNLPFVTIGLSDQEIACFEEIYNKLCTKFFPKFDYETIVGFQQFQSLGHFMDIDTKHVIRLGDKNIFIVLANVCYTYTGRKGRQDEGQEYQAWGTLFCDGNLDLGHIIIRPESFEDKIRELLQPVELDFDEDPAFSKKFYVLADDKIKATKTLNAAIREYIMEIPSKDFVIETMGNKLVIGNNAVASADAALCFATFLTKVSAYIK